MRLFLFSILFVFSGLSVSAQVGDAPPRSNTEARVSPNASVAQTIGTTVIEVQYGRPSVRGRQILGDLVPLNEVWRTGANEATTFAVTDPLLVEGQLLPAGVYALFTVPDEDAWEIVFNEVAQQWGSFNHDPSRDVLRVTVSAEDTEPTEQLTILFKDVSDPEATLWIVWDTFAVPVHLVVPPPGDGRPAGPDPSNRLY